MAVAAAADVEGAVVAVAAEGAATEPLRIPSLLCL